MKTSFKVAFLNLKINRKFVLGWVVATNAIMLLYMLLFPQVKEIAQAKIDAMPEEILQLVGISNLTDMSNYVNYYAMVNNILIIVISIFAVTFGANLFTKEENKKTIYFLSNLKISRGQIYFGKILIGVFATLSITITNLIISIICGYLSKDASFIVLDLIKVGILNALIPFCFLILGVFLGASLTTINASLFGSMLVVLSFLLGYLGNLLEDKANFLSYFSPFELFGSTKALALDFTTSMASLGALIVVIIFLILGKIIYQKRDYQV